MRALLCTLLAVIPLHLPAQRVEVVLDSVVGYHAEIAAAKSELGLRHGLAATPGVQVLALPDSRTRGSSTARYRIVAQVVSDTNMCTLRVRVIDRRIPLTVEHAEIRADWKALSDSASALGARIGRQLVVRNRTPRPAN